MTIATLKMRSTRCSDVPPLVPHPREHCRGEPRRGARLRPRREQRLEAAGRRERRRALRAGLEVRPDVRLDLEVAGGYRLHELNDVAAGHVSSNSRKRRLAR